MGIWYQGIAVGPAVSSLVSYGFLKYTESHPQAAFKSWQIVYLIFGLITIVVGICVIIFLPDNPVKSRLTDAEKIRIINRVRSNQTGIENKTVKWSQVCEVLTDFRNYIIFLIVLACAVPNVIVSSFSSIIISGFGYTKNQTLLPNLPGAAVTLVAIIVATVLAGRFNARGIAVICLVIPTMIGGAFQAWLPRSNKPGLLIGNAMTSTTFATVPLLYSWITANYAGHSKKTTMSAILLIALCVGNAIGSKTFRAADAPAYIPAKVYIFAFLACAIVLILCLNAFNMRENRRRDRLGEVEMPPDWQLLDLTDKQNLRFRYCL